MNRFYIIVSIVICTISHSLSQSSVSVRLVPTTMSESSREICFDTQIKNLSEDKVYLAEQNYRLFYDALQLKFKADSIQSLLPSNAYSSVVVNQALHNIDATGYGDLKFGQNIGFLNFSIITSGDQDNRVLLPPHSHWVSSTSVCFHTNGKQNSMNIVWARESLTKGYATAFTELTGALENGDVQSLQIMDYQDFFKLSDKEKTTQPVVLTPDK